MKSTIHKCECSACQQSKTHDQWQLHHQTNVFFSRLDEQQRRWYAGLKSKEIGIGGDSQMAKISGMNVETIRRGRREIEMDLIGEPSESIRTSGGGRATIEKKSPEVVACLTELLKDETAGDPMGEQKWQRSSLRHLSHQLMAQGKKISHVTVKRLLKKMGYSLKANEKRIAGKRHPDRNQQFEYIASQKKAFLDEGLPVISVDTKKKELIGNFKNNGRTWCEEAEAVNDHDFPQAAFCKAVPYGIYDIKQNHGHVYIGQSADTPEFAVSAIANWWENVGKAVYPAAKKLLILGDAGGSNGCRPRRWKEQLQTQLADKLKIEVVVSHYPTGASKWNPIEHRMFGPISMNWSGKPLRSLKDMVNYIQGTVTKTGLEVKATLVDQVYEKGIQITKSVMDKLDIEFHNVCPRWNYTIKPRTAVC